MRILDAYDLTGSLCATAETAHTPDHHMEECATSGHRIWPLQGSNERS